MGPAEPTTSFLMNPDPAAMTQPPLRVLHIGKFFPPDVGGMETFLADLIAAQRAGGAQAFALVHGQPRADDPDWLIRVPVQMQLVYAPLALGWWRALAQAIERLQPDVLHLHMPNTGVFHALLLPSARALPWVVHWHSDVVVSQRSPLALRMAYWLYRPLEQAVLERAEAIISTSPPYLQASEPLSRWQGKAVVVPLGISLPAPLGQPSTLPVAWQKSALRVLSMGRLAHYKGFETLVNAVAAAPGVQLVIAGQGELMPRLQTLCKSLPQGAQARIVLAGRVTEDAKHALLASCDVFALASTERTEAFGMVLLEAMAHAKPCVVSDLSGSGMPWLVQQAQAGWYDLPPGDPVAWAERLQALAQNRQDLLRCGLQGQKCMQQQFGIDAVARQIDSVLRHVATALPAEPAAVMGIPAADRILMVIPARDESATIAAVVQSLRQRGWHHVLVVDDHSHDDTAAQARAAGAQVLQPVLPLGAWGAMQLGIRLAVQQGYLAVITMDADGQHEPQEIPLLLAEAGEADVVIGAHPQRVSRLRKLAWQWFRALSGFALEDLTSGFRYYNHRAMNLLASPEATLIDYQDVGVLLLIRRAGLRIREVPVQMNARQNGRSRIFYSWGSVMRYMLTTTLLCMARWNSGRVGKSADRDRTVA